MNYHGSFSEEALSIYQDLASFKYVQAKSLMGQGSEHLDNDPIIEKKPLPKKAAAKLQGSEEADRYDEMDKDPDPEFSQPRCPVGQWRFPPQKGICQPKESVQAQRQDSERDRLNNALRNRLEKLKKTQKHKAKQQESKDPVVVNEIVERKSPTVKLEPNTIYGVLTEDGLQVLNHSEPYDFTAALRS